MKLPRFLSKLIPNYEIIDMKEWPAKGVIEIYFKKEDSQAPMICSVCGTTLGGQEDLQRLVQSHELQSLQEMIKTPCGVLIMIV